MIIIEGCDNTGKTSLQQEILKKYPHLVPGYKQERPPENKQEYMDRFWTFLGKDPRHTRNTVFDRFYFSELVYGPLLRGNVIFSEAENNLVKKLMDDHTPLVIYCYRSPEQILATFDEREQLEGVQERIGKVVDLYNEVMMPWVGKGNFVIYDYGNPLSVASTWKKVQEYVGYFEDGHFENITRPLKVY